MAGIVVDCHQKESMPVNNLKYSLTEVSLLSILPIKNTTKTLFVQGQFFC